MKLSQKQIDKYLKNIVNRKIKLPKYNPELKKKILVKFNSTDDGSRAIDKNLASKEGMKRAMATLNRFYKYEKKMEKKEKKNGKENY